ncbi:MAG: 4-(cytidine 5'-diphospho)-2-C-methyl-D-erythritol kinase [Bacteroidota bacterium]
MVVFPNCKINLGLNIIGKRLDGFHNIETLFYPVALSDALEIIPAADGIFGFHVSGLEIPGDAARNLCVEAFRLLQGKFSLPAVKIHLHKVIPMGAGLGGGSSDGAFTLKLLNSLFGLGLNNDHLREYASQLGSDCPFFIENNPCLGFEKGDLLVPFNVDLEGLTLVIVDPVVHVSTAEAYASIIPAAPARPLKELVNLPVPDWKDALVNDFEIPVFEKYPVIGKIKTLLYDMGAEYASMSGSGAAVYAFFRGDVSPGELFPGCFIWVSKPL